MLRQKIRLTIGTGLSAKQTGLIHEMKDLYGSVDAVGNDRFVFNIKGNDFRFVAMICFDVRTVYIRFVGTHAEYDKLKDCSVI